MNKKTAIVINGFTYGGSNLLWNLLQSHPCIVSVMRETGLYLYPSILNKIQPLIRLFFRLFPAHFNSRIKALESRKRLNIESIDHCEKYPEVNYTSLEISQAIPSFKSLNNDVFLNKLFEKVYDEVYFIAIIRNGLALCESWKRRGRSMQEAIDNYLRIGHYFMEQEQNNPRFKVIRMEDILIDPFAVSLELNKFLGLYPQELDHLRLKSKKLVGKDGSHEVRFGKQNSKYWFDKTSIEQFIDKGINEKQLKQLTDKDRATFESKAGGILAHFGYS